MWAYSTLQHAGKHNGRSMDTFDMYFNTLHYTQRITRTHNHQSNSPTRSGHWVCVCVRACVHACVCVHMKNKPVRCMLHVDSSWDVGAGFMRPDPLNCSLMWGWGSGPATSTFTSCSAGSHTLICCKLHPSPLEPMCNQVQSLELGGLHDAGILNILFKSWAIFNCFGIFRSIPVFYFIKLLCFFTFLSLKLFLHTIVRSHQTFNLLGNGYCLFMNITLCNNFKEVTNSETFFPFLPLSLLFHLGRLCEHYLCARWPGFNPQPASMSYGKP